MPSLDLKDKLEKIVVNVGIGKFSAGIPNFEEKLLPELTREMALITGQKPAPRPAKKSIATFKVRAGSIVGLKVTLRDKRMIDFFNRLVKTALPRLRDFRGINLKSVDQSGNLSIGLKEHLIFPEVSPETSKINFGMEITIVPQIKDREGAIALFRQIGVPLKKN